MAYHIELCNALGVALPGSDGNFNIDLRLGHRRRSAHVAEYRERFRKNFPHKADFWTHYSFRGGPLIRIPEA